MRSCRTASVVATGVLLAIGAIAACRESVRPDVPPLTTARPDGSPLIETSIASAAGEGGAGDEGGATSTAVMAAALDSPVKAKFVDTPAKLEAGVCQRVLVAVVKGKITALSETLAAGDVLSVTHADAFDATGPGTVVWASLPLGADCAVLSRPALVKNVVRGGAAPKLEWAGGTMAARLDVGAKISPELYLGRLEGTAPVGEHIHASSWEILAAVEANGVFTLEGTEGRLGARQVVAVPPGAKHAWKPEPGSKLVAIQMYSPPGPEQRFVALAAADKDAGASVKDAGARDAR